MSEGTFGDFSAETVQGKSAPWNVEKYLEQDKIRTIHFGIGSIGAATVRACLSNPEIEIVGAIDAQPGKAGRDLGEVTGAGHSLGVPIHYDADALLKDVYADVIVHCTGSSLTEVYPQLMAIISAEKNVVSTCEELSFPWARYPDVSQKLDRRARETGVRVLGTGVNPGFVMDLLPLIMLTAVHTLRSIKVERVVDLRNRRIQLQRKAGVGLSPAGFKQGVADGALGHVGLRESLMMIADTLAWRLEDVTETIEPVLSKERARTDVFSIDKGYAIGLQQTAAGIMNGQEVIKLTLHMSLGARDPRDVIAIDGDPPVRVHLPGGIQGDAATAAIVANCVPAVARSRMNGLLSMRDLPLLPYYRPRRQS
jgi:4-hydroxy-tetrahydrodipicolinate reductase